MTINTTEMAVMLAEQAAAIQANTAAIQANTVAIDATWTLVAGILVMLMQAGFAMVESGSVRMKNASNILVKNLLDVCLGTVCWWLFGYGVAFGKDYGKFIGGSLFAGVNEDYVINDFGTDDQTFHYLYWFFQWAFCATAATIVSGAMAERCTLFGYGIFSAIMTTLIYPVVVHWTWGGGFLTEEGYIDFAGSGIVHMCGGVAALVGAATVGARKGRFDPENSADFVPHSVPLVVLGTFILWFGWYGFNAGSTVAMSGEQAASAQTATLVAMNTTISAAVAGLVAFVIRFAVSRKYDVCALANGILAGLVSITAPCDGVYAWSAALIGFIGGFVFIGASALLKRLRVDDPIDAFAVHGACGAWGVMSVAFFNSASGVFYGGEGKIIGVQLLGIVCIAVWTAALSFATFGALRVAKLLRVSDDIETQGLDSIVSPNPAYVLKGFEQSSI